MGIAKTEKTHLTPPQVATQLGCAVDTVLRFIHSGALRASNLGQSIRPRWRIARADLEAFLDARSNQKPPSPQRRRTIPRPTKEYV